MYNIINSLIRDEEGRSTDRNSTQDEFTARIGFPSAWAVGRVPSVWALDRVPSAWTLDRVPSSRAVGRFPSAWAVGRVPSAWTLDRVPSAGTLDRVPSSRAVGRIPSARALDRVPSARVVGLLTIDFPHLWVAGVDIYISRYSSFLVTGYVHV